MTGAAHERATVLIVEDEAVLRASMARGLARLPGLRVEQAGSVGEALSVLDLVTPDLIVCDVDLPDRPGIELIGELGRRGLSPRIVFMSAYLRAYRAQIPPHAQLDVIEKPIPMEELRGLVRHHLERRQDEAGPLSAAALVQLAHRARLTVVLKVDQGAHLLGELVVVDGAPWAASDSQGHGPEAMQRLLGASGVRVRARALEGEPGERNLAPGVAPAAAEPALPERAAAVEPPDPRFDAAWERGVGALLSRDFATALRAFQDARAVRPSDARVELNLRRLAEMGYGEATKET